MGHRIESNDTHELACVVLSLGGDPRLVGAVRSLLEQTVQLEIVVVNSGGGDAGALLREAGIDVPVVDRQVRLFPGAARNLGLDATGAPYVAFLAADCRAEPGWAEGRLAAHRAGAAAVSTVMSPRRLSTRSECAALLQAHIGRIESTPPALRRLHGLSYERSLFERHGRFREDMRAGEDSELNPRIWKRERVAWAPEVRTHHIYPNAPIRLLRDQYRRGQRRVIVERELRRITIPGIVAQMLARIPLRLRIASAMTDSVERSKLLRSWPLLVPATIAYITGVLNAGPEIRRIRELARASSLAPEPGRGSRRQPQPLPHVAR